MPSRRLGARTRRARPSAPPLTYLSLREHPLRRLARLFAGLALYGFGLSLLVRASLGANPWGVLYEGVAHRTSLGFGTVSAALGVLVLLLWIPLRLRPRLGTFANIVVMACASDAGLALVPEGLGLPARICLLVGGVLLSGLAVAVYVGARLGPGPRDGLMTGTAAVTGCSLRRVRTLMEVVVLASGWALGGTVGVGTALYALAIGPVAQACLPRFTHASPSDRVAPAGRPAASG